jgi:hypothetical protein
MRLLNFTALETMAIFGSLFFGVSNHLTRCAERDFQYNLFKEVYPTTTIPTIFTFEDEGYLVCTRPGNDCGITSEGLLSTPQHEALNNFYSAYANNTLAAFYRTNDWNTIFPDMDGINSGILAGLQDGSMKTVVGSDASIIVIPGDATTVSDENVLYALKIEE